MNPPDTNYFANASQTLSNGLTPFAQSFTYGGNTIGSSRAQRNAWQGAALTNGAGPNANNSGAPFSFDQFALGLNPFINPGTGVPLPRGQINVWSLVTLAVVVFVVMAILRRI